MKLSLHYIGEHDRKRNSVLIPISLCSLFSRSESPSQVFLFLVNTLLRKLKEVPADKWSRVFVAYDNMCNLNGMTVAKKELPLPIPFNRQVQLDFQLFLSTVSLSCCVSFDRLWLSVSKIIDVFHLRNHKRPECHTEYNPQSLKEVHPNYNTQACEQTFAWLGRFHKILSSVPKVHNHFFLHRLVKRRNLYNSQCYRKGKKPLLPNVKHFKQ